MEKIKLSEFGADKSHTDRNSNGYEIPIIKQLSINGDKSSTHAKSKLEIYGKNFPKSTVVFFGQVILVYVVCAVALYNLTFKSEEKNSKLWVAFLSSALGYLLPNPSIKRNLNG